MRADTACVCHSGVHPPQVLAAIENGTPLLIENLPADIDAVLDPVLSKSTIKRGRATIMRVGDAEVEVHPSFRLYLQVGGGAGAVQRQGAGAAGLQLASPASRLVTDWLAVSAFASLPAR